MPKTLTATRESIQPRLGRASGLISTWLPVAIGLAIIVIESTDGLSAEKTSHFLRPFFAWLFGPMTDEHWQVFHHILRKCGHFVGYGSLGIAWLRAWLRTLATRLQWTQAAWRLRAAALGVVCTFLTASADEYHQTFLPSRTGQFSDVLLDTCGALIFTSIVAIFWWRQHSAADVH